MFLTLSKDRGRQLPPPPPPTWIVAYSERHDSNWQTDQFLGIEYDRIKNLYLGSRKWISLHFRWTKGKSSGHILATFQREQVGMGANPLL